MGMTLRDLEILLDLPPPGSIPHYLPSCFQKSKLFSSPNDVENMLRACSKRFLPPPAPRPVKKKGATPVTSPSDPGVSSAIGQVDVGEGQSTLGKGAKAGKGAAAKRKKADAGITSSTRKRRHSQTEASVTPEDSAVGTEAGPSQPKRSKRLAKQA